MRTEMTSDLSKVSAAIGRPLPKQFLEHLTRQPGMYREDGLLLYSVTELVERNQSYQIQRWLPDFLLVGDDSGGRGFLIRFDDNKGTEVVMSDLGALMEDNFTTVANSLDEWAAAGYQIPI